MYRGQRRARKVQREQSKSSRKNGSRARDAKIRHRFGISHSCVSIACAVRDDEREGRVNIGEWNERFLTFSDLSG